MNQVPLVPGVVYHIYNRGNNGEDIFTEERNYDYFLRLYDKYISPVAETYAYCLLRNHFHLMVKIKDLPGFENLAGLNPKPPHQHFSNFFNAYTKAINKAYQRSGSLFEKPFKRKPVTNDRYFKSLVAYIHQNPQKHNLIADFRDWPYSSYQDMISEKSTRLAREMTLSWFDGRSGLVQYHETIADFKGIAKLIDDE
jgi:REP element-mobilizing transposase RayT